MAPPARLEAPGDLEVAELAPQQLAENPEELTRPDRAIAAAQVMAAEVAAAVAVQRQVVRPPSTLLLANIPAVQAGQALHHQSEALLLIMQAAVAAEGHPTT